MPLLNPYPKGSSEAGAAGAGNREALGLCPCFTRMRKCSFCCRKFKLSKLQARQAASSSVSKHWP